MRALILVCLLGWSSAWGDQLIVNTFSKHYMAADDYNENNYGLGYQNKKYEFGAFRNTHKLLSVYVGQRYHLGDGFSISSGLIHHPASSFYVALKYETKNWLIGVSPLATFLQAKIEF